MSVVVSLQKDPFVARLKQAVGRARALGALGHPKDFSHVRRPFRGISIKEDTWATMEVVDSDGVPVPLMDSGSRLSTDQVSVLMDHLGMRTQVKRTEPREDAESQSSDMQPGQSAPPLLSSFKDGSSAIHDDAISFTEPGDFTGRSDNQSLVVPANVRAAENRALAASELQRLQKQTQNADTRSRYQRFGEGGLSLRYSNFIITGVREARAEKYQIMETFGHPFIFFFGEKARIYQFSGVLVNSLDFQWRAEWWANYDEVIRGTKLVERGARLNLSWDDIVTSGYILSAEASEDAQAPYLVRFNFHMFVTNYFSTAPIGEPDFPRPMSVSIDKSMWVDDASLKRLSNQPLSVDEVRKANLNLLKPAAGGGQFQSFVRGVADTLAMVSHGTSLISNYVSEYRKMLGYQSVAAGAFPVLDELRARPDLARLLPPTLPGLPSTLDQSTAEFLAAQLSDRTRRLVATGQDDGAGNPEFAVQDEELIINLTRRYNKKFYRRIPILSPSNRFVKPQDNTKQFQGKYRDNEDEYVQAVLVEASPRRTQFRDRMTEEEKAQNLDQVIAQMILKLNEAGIPMTKDSTQAVETNLAMSEFALRMSMLPIVDNISGPVGDSSSDGRPSAEQVEDTQGFYQTSQASDPTPQGPKAAMSTAPVVRTKRINNQRVTTQDKLQTAALVGGSLASVSADLEALLLSKRRSLQAS